MFSNTFHNLSSFQILDFGHNNVTGNFYDLFYLLSKATLQVLYISDNQFTGSLPDITIFSFLNELFVDSNQLNGYLPQKFEHKSVLYSLHLLNNYLQGSLPNFTSFSFLENLNLIANNFSGSLPDFTGCSSPIKLLLGMNKFTDWKTHSIGQLKNLVQLDLAMNPISSTPNHLFHVSITFRISYNNLNH